MAIQETSGGAYAPPGRTVSFRDLLAKQDKEQAAALRRWADALERAASANDWSAVRAVAHGLSETGVLLEEFTDRLLEQAAAGSR